MSNITFEFVGGPHDGKRVMGRRGEPSDAERYYLFSNHGTVGQRFKIASDYVVETLAREGLESPRAHHFQRHFYMVTRRREDDGDVFIRAVYLPPKPKKSAS